MQIYGEDAESGFIDVYKNDHRYGVYPFFTSGNVAISSTSDGLFIVNQKWPKPSNNNNNQSDCGGFFSTLSNLCEGFFVRMMTGS